MPHKIYQEVFRPVDRPTVLTQRAPLTVALIDTATQVGAAIQVTLETRRVLQRWAATKRVSLAAHGYQLHYRVTSETGVLPIELAAWTTAIPGRPIKKPAHAAE
jgi:2-polyprenyl-6-methoxyphenol hydroxylase-like FAD-dependent oxidoreductase